MGNSSTSWFGKGYPLPKLLRGGSPRGILPPQFFARRTDQVAPALLGKILLVRSNPKYPLGHPRALTTLGRIVEVEAYRGADPDTDPAAHSARGHTPRSAPMFEGPGFAYVYLIYGMYEMLNFVTEPEGYPGAVLIRAVEPLLGFNLMKRRRSPTDTRNWTNGPGRLTVAMGISLRHNRQPLSGPSIFVIDDGYVPKSILVSQRVGITQGAEKDWRYFLEGNPFVSRVVQNKSARPWRGNKG